ncbi:hypothetical protein DSECCO2_563250 [anaerobic digester metagenome]
MTNSKKDIEKIIKPKISVGILITLVCLGPFGNLIFSIAIKDYSRLMVYAIFTLPTLMAVGAYWFWHILKRINLNRDIEQIQKSLRDCDAD